MKTSGIDMSDITVFKADWNAVLDFLQISREQNEKLRRKIAKQKEEIARLKEDIADLLGDKPI